MNKTAGLLIALSLAVGPGALAFGAPHGRNSDAYVLARGTNSTMSGSLEDLERLHDRYKTPYLWFRRNGRAYVVLDTKVIDAAEALFAPVRQLSDREEAIASREEALDREEEALDAEQDGVDADEDDFSDEGAGPADAARQEALRQRQKALSDRHADLARRQRDLSRKERALDQEEEKLDAAAEASLGTLMDRAVRDGVATPAESR